MNDSVTLRRRLKNLGVAFVCVTGFLTVVGFIYSKKDGLAWASLAASAVGFVLEGVGGRPYCCDGEANVSKFVKSEMTVAASLHVRELEIERERERVSRRASVRCRPSARVARRLRLFVCRVVFNVVATQRRPKDVLCRFCGTEYTCEPFVHAT